MKLTVIGGGGVRSMFLAKSIAQRAKDLHITELVFMDNDPEKLRIYGGMAAQVSRRVNPELSFRLTGDPEDAVQDAFLRCLEKAPDFESPAHARAWLLRVTVNGCKSRLRAPWRRRTAPLLDAYPAAAPEEGTLLEAMQALPARDRAVLHLYYYEGYQTAEIAALTGLREGSVRSRLTRARTRLRQVLKGEDE